MRLGTYYRAQLLKHFGIRAVGENVLDVGAYDGYWLSTQKARNKYALDLEVVKKYQNVTYIKASALIIPFTSNHFDQVFAFDVIEHIKEGQEKKFFSELIRVCKRNGKITLSTPSKSITLFPSFMTGYISSKWGHDKCNGYSKKELKNMLSIFDGIIYQVVDNSAPLYRLLYMMVRFLWFIRQDIAKKVVHKIALYDAKHKKGDKGFYFIDIKKMQ